MVAGRHHSNAAQDRGRRGRDPQWSRAGDRAREGAHHAGALRPRFLEPAPAILDAHKLGVYPRAIGEPGLNQLVQRPASALGLCGTFSWQSLRWGAIRTAIRDNERTHHIASLAATRLDTIGRHQHREQLITHSVAGQLGL